MNDSIDSGRSEEEGGRGGCESTARKEDGGQEKEKSGVENRRRLPQSNSSFGETIETPSPTFSPTVPNHWEGYLVKISKNYKKRRYFVTHSHFLQYYKSKSDVTPKAMRGCYDLNFLKPGNESIALLTLPGDIKRRRCITFKFQDGSEKILREYQKSNLDLLLDILKRRRTYYDRRGKKKEEIERKKAAYERGIRERQAKEIAENEVRVAKARFRKEVDDLESNSAMYETRKKSLARNYQINCEAEKEDCDKKLESLRRDLIAVSIVLQSDRAKAIEKIRMSAKRTLETLTRDIKVKTTTLQACSVECEHLQNILRRENERREAALVRSNLERSEAIESVKGLLTSAKGKASYVRGKVTLVEDSMRAVQENLESEIMEEKRAREERDRQIAETEAKYRLRMASTERDDSSSFEEMKNALEAEIVETQRRYRVEKDCADALARRRDAGARIAFRPSCWTRRLDEASLRRKKRAVRLRRDAVRIEMAIALLDRELESRIPQDEALVTNALESALAAIGSAVKSGG
eukprot:g645.t1